MNPTLPSSIEPYVSDDLRVKLDEWRRLRTAAVEANAAYKALTDETPAVLKAEADRKRDVFARDPHAEDAGKSLTDAHQRRVSAALVRVRPLEDARDVAAQAVAEGMELDRVVVQADLDTAIAQRRADLAEGVSAVMDGLPQLDEIRRLDHFVASYPSVARGQAMPIMVKVPSRQDGVAIGELLSLIRDALAQPDVRFRVRDGKAQPLGVRVGLYGSNSGPEVTAAGGPGTARGW